MFHSVSQDAINYVKLHQKELVGDFCSRERYPTSPKPFTIFMAGSPGSGKTEFSKAYIKQIELKDPLHKVIRLDVDELREKIPLYTGSNSNEVQPASTILFDKIFDRIQENGQNVLVDGTFSSERSLENVQRAINRGRSVGIIYLYQNPRIAWTYTQKRELLEGRTVPKSVFIKAYFTARINVNVAKEKFGNKVTLDFFEKDKNNDFEKNAHSDVQNLDDFFKEEYTQDYLEQNLPNSL